MQFSTDTRTADESIRPPPRRLYTNAFKLNVVRETLRPGASVSIIARRHDLNSNMLFRWRREYHQGLLRDDPQPADASSAAQFVVDVGVVNKNGGVTLLPPPKPSAQAEAKSSADAKPKDKQSSQDSAGGRIEICLKNGVTVRVSTPFDDGDLQRVSGATIERVEHHAYDRAADLAKSYAEHYEAEARTTKHTRRRLKGDDGSAEMKAGHWRIIEKEIRGLARQTTPDFSIIHVSRRPQNSQLSGTR